MDRPTRSQRVTSRSPPQQSRFPALRLVPMRRSSSVLGWALLGQAMTLLRSGVSPLPSPSLSVEILQQEALRFPTRSWPAYKVSLWFLSHPQWLWDFSVPQLCCIAAVNKSIVCSHHAALRGGFFFAHIPP